MRKGGSGSACGSNDWRTIKNNEEKTPKLLFAFVLCVIYNIYYAFNNHFDYKNNTKLRKTIYLANIITVLLFPIAPICRSTLHRHEEKKP